MHTIKIRVSGGVVQDVENVPPGITVQIIDYDCDGEDCADRDEHGDECNIAIHTA